MNSLSKSKRNIVPPTTPADRRGTLPGLKTIAEIKARNPAARTAF